MTATKRVRALVVKTEFVPRFGMVVMNSEGKRDESRFPIVPVEAIEDLIHKGLIADDFKESMLDEKPTTDKPQLDHDGDGKAGGSTSGGTGDDMVTLRDQYKSVLGKRPFNGWDADELRRRMAEAEGSEPDGDDAADDAAQPPA